MLYVVGIINHSRLVPAVFPSTYVLETWYVLHYFQSFFRRIVRQPILGQAPRAVRDDDFYNISGRLGYLITKSMEISITVGKETRNSNLYMFDYDDKYAYLRFSFGFDLRSRGMFSEEAVYY